MKLEKEIKQKRFKNECQKAIINLMYTGSWVQALATHRLKPYNISAQQYNALRILRGQHPNPVRASSIQERMLDPMSNVSRIVEKLRQKQYLERTVCPEDRRAVHVRITEKGLNLLAEIDKTDQKWEENFKNLTDSELLTLNHLLDKIRS